MDVEGGMKASSFLDPIPEDVSVAATRHAVNLSTVSAVASSSASGDATIPQRNTGAGTGGKNKKWIGKRRRGEDSDPSVMAESGGDSAEAVLAGRDDVSDANASLGGANVEAVEPFSSSPSAENPEVAETPKSIFLNQNCKKWSMLALGILAFLVVVIGAGLYAIVVRVNDQTFTPDEMLPPAPSMEPTTNNALPPFNFIDKTSPKITTYTQSEVMLFDDAFLKVYGTTEENLFDMTTPEGKGRDWMIYSDRSINPDDEQRVQQRYILAVLHYATNGDFWNDKTNWMDAGTSECGWYGVACNGGDIERIELPQNNIKGSLPKEIGSLSSLKALNMSWNTLSSTIPDELFNLLEDLELLDLQNNTITGTLPTKTTLSSRLRHLELKGNNLVGDCPFFPNLEYLCLDKNNLTSIDIRYSTSSPSLKKLKAYRNNIPGTLPSSWNSPSLIELDLGHNFWIGTIPEDLWNLPSLKTLFLDHCNLTGTLPTSSENTKMHRLWLDSNTLSGPIPSNFGWNWTKLYTLKLQNNQFTGNITLDQCNKWESFEGSIQGGSGNSNSSNIWELETDCTVNCACCTACDNNPDQRR